MMKLSHRHVFYDGPQDGKAIGAEHAPLVKDFMREYRRALPNRTVAEVLTGGRSGEIVRSVDRYMLESQDADCDGIIVCRYRFYDSLPIETP